MLGGVTTYYYYMKFANKTNVSDFTTSLNRTPTFESCMLIAMASKTYAKINLCFEEIE